MNTKLRLIVMNFFQYAVWGAYLISMGRYLSSVGLGIHIGLFYAVQGFVSLFMPAVIGIIADRWIPAQKLLAICHALAAIFMVGAGYYGMTAGYSVEFATLFTLYTCSVAFYMPTIALSNSVAYSVLAKAGLNAVKHFPPIRVFGTIGFICSMLFVNFAKYDGIAYQEIPIQFIVSAVLGFILAIYALTLPACETSRDEKKQSLTDALGLKAFVLFKQKKMAIFFIFSMLLGASLQITNGYANDFIFSFGSIDTYKDTFGVHNANALISLSQMSETLCILLIPFFLRRFGIKKVMLISMFAWVVRFGLFGLGNPGSGFWMFILSMIVYGIAFDFFNISGSLFVDTEVDKSIRSSAQGLFMMMTNGFGATIGMLGAQVVVNHFVYSQTDPVAIVSGWQHSWFIFAGYAFVVMVVFALAFKYKHDAHKVIEKI
ncbi:MAG: MFS transporter [Bacteroidales bacterium]|jgi:NHS family nucleoside permease-like MFS transporter/NHS family xanthosine MFS transporter|nr:MFS transporter [Bacteroidales bacterium]